jgi:hypothetical protein
MIFFSVNDIFLVPICLLVLLGILYLRARRCPDPKVKRLYYAAFWFKAFFTIAYTLISEFYFGGGDTSLYLHSTRYLRQAIDDDFGMIGVTLKSLALTEHNPLSPYFLYGEYGGGISYYYMLSPGNFFIPRLGLIPAYLFSNSYLCISLCFSFFSLAGVIRLFKFFYHYYPYARKEIAIAVLFLPSVAFWSSGLLKDTICLGCVGLILYGLLNVFVKRKNIVASVFWVITASYLLYYIKSYILLTLLLAIMIWLFLEFNSVIKNDKLRRFITVFAVILGLLVSFFAIQELTSEDALKQYQFENIISSAEYQRSVYEQQDRASGAASSYYEIGSSNYAVMILSSINTVFFRPYLWEVKSSAAVLSGIEAFFFLILTAFLFFKKGLLKPFGFIFRDPALTMAFVFSITFAIGVGISTPNFGALSRYKIPCLPFFLISILIVYRKAQLDFPRWFSRVLKLLK